MRAFSHALDGWNMCVRRDFFQTMGATLARQHSWHYQRFMEAGVSGNWNWVAGVKVHWLNQWDTAAPDKQLLILDSMRWFSHQRSPSPPGRHATVSSVAACCVRPSYGARPTMHCQWGWLGSFSFLSLVTLTFELQWDFCTMYLTAKFDRPTFSRSEVIVQTNWQMHTLTNKQMPLKTSTSLRYTTPVGKKCQKYTWSHGKKQIHNWQ